jgi:hypothetical protein
MIKVGWMGVVGGGREKEIHFVGWPATGRHHTGEKKLDCILFFVSLSFAIFLSTEL